MFGTLDFIYVPTPNVAKAVEYYVTVLRRSGLEDPRRY